MSLNNLTNQNLSNFKSTVIIGQKSINLHKLGNNINDIIEILLNKGKLPIIPKIFFEESSMNKNVNNMIHNNSNAATNDGANNAYSNVRSNVANDGSNNKNSNKNNKIYNKIDDIYGQKIIDKYYKIKHSINQLSIVKSFIESIIKTIKVELEKYKVSKSNYNIKKRYLIKKFESSLSETFTQKSFNDFKDDYVKQSFNIFKEFNENIPLFQYIFNNTYIGIKDTKNYFNKLFKKYTKERNILSNFIKEDFGLLAFSPFFDIDEITEVQTESSKTNKTNLKYNNYIVYNSTNINPKLQEFNNNNKIPLNEKINEFNLMYISVYHSDYYTMKHKEKIEKIYNEVKESINALLNVTDTMNLYDIILITLNLDFSLFELMFYYCEPLLFDTAMANHQNIKKYILDKLNTLDLYYDSYKDWLGTEIVSDKNSITNLIKFEDFFKEVMYNMQKSGENENYSNMPELVTNSYKKNPFNFNIEEYKGIPLPLTNVPGFRPENLN